MKNKPFDYYLQEALKELEREDWNPKRCERLLTEGIKVVIDNESGETVEVSATSPEKALAEALSKLTPWVKTVVEDDE
ncbi:hypothetical protein GFV12_05230 [Desulfurobacterium thermolithotrophum]|uniref:hypothetical protein n=1 Tax=Desulfurobacterium thermolithotrophum TaxID=64160 RepID=UPI0013D0BB03|nr:hypothetical protein [Desulfurobacterium thermolithotrophum]